MTNFNESPLTVAFCINPQNEHHERYIDLFLRLCASKKIPCKALRISPLTIENSTKAIGSIALTLIVCLDSQYAALILQTRAQLHISAPLIFVDLNIPNGVPQPLPSRCITISTEFSLFVPHMCSLIPSIKNIHVVGILYDQSDAILTPLVPEIASWLEERNYKVKMIVRKPTITSADVLAFGACDLLIFLNKSTPEDYAQRLSIVCKQQKTIIYSTNSSMLAYGAAFAFTPAIEEMVEKTVTILSSYLSSNTIDISAIVHCQLLINGYEVANNEHLTSSLDVFMKLSQTITVATPTTPEKVSAYLRLEQAPLE